ncbi:hypothetical protein CK501_10640 [Halovibrio salipaludis]|uniref:Uncharacterized protein n=1 Tax=Halovibrio salipaludis TaxID=2032626 RepID=A0A2A2F645_9GAMM|nr:hypothetical protein [Halovibrio salipaludis]PAU80099.1 hypothetical protein CK501_10640 [Halovibrio salipaludis]
MVGGISGNSPLPVAPDPARRPDAPGREAPRAEPLNDARSAPREDSGQARTRRAEAVAEPEVVRPRRSPDTDSLPLRNQEALSAYDRIGSAAVAEDVELVGVDIRI